MCGYVRLKAGSQYDDRVSFRKLPSISSICEHAPYDETIRNKQNGRIDLDSIPTSTYGRIKGNSRDLTSQVSKV